MNIYQASKQFSMIRLCCLLLTLLLVGLCQTAEASSPDNRHGIGEDYNPTSPGNPGTGEDVNTETKYKLTVVTNPVGAGNSYANTSSLKAGEQTYVYTYNNTGFTFSNWTIEEDVVSTETGFYYIMPEYDVTIVANYNYNPVSPGNPSPEEQKVKHPVTVRAIPSAAASMSPSGVFDMEENTSRDVYAYSNDGWKLTGWTINGEQQSASISPIRVTMGEKALDIAAYFTYEPTSPSNPGANYYNPSTGQVIIDDFTPGNLYTALRNIVGSNDYSNISSLIVKGQMTSNDMGYMSYLSNIGTIDLSRTGGVTEVPSYAFESMGALSILLPSTITSIGYRAFRNCNNLASLTIYAMEPPVCDEYAFYQFTNKDNCTVYVPRGAIELYQNADQWKDFTILPIMTDVHVLQVTLPEDATDGRYKHNSIEIVNQSSGVRQKYVISDRLVYTFNGLQKDEQYNVYMLSQSGLEIGRIENVVIPNDDIEVAFEDLKTLHTAVAKVLAPDGSDVTSQVSVEWLKPLEDGTAIYLRKAVSISEIPEGEQLLCRIGLDSKLGTVYVNPEDVEFTVNGSDNNCIINLVPFRAVGLSGTVVNGDGSALSGASVSANQMLNGKYSKTYTAKTDRKGEWSINVLDAPSTNLTFAASECVNVNDTIGAIDSGVASFDCGKITMKSIVGARVSYGFTYHAAGEEEVENYYPDYQNVAISVYNETQGRPHNEVSVQYPLLAVLDENINAGDKLKLTATSKTGAFDPIVETVTIGDDQRAEVTFDIVGKGGIQASFEMTENPAVTAMLYSDKGELVKKQSYSDAKTTFTGLEDGSYTLVSMGQSDLMNSILRLSNFAEIGLTEGKDYIVNAVKVESGRLAEVTNSEIPAFDESLFYYTNSTTGFSANKSSITTGNYLTLRAAIDFKGVYKDDISNVALVVDLPEACDFVEQSVIQGPNLLPYTIDNKRLTIQLGNDYQSQTRFCVIPTSGGLFNASASIVFDYKGKNITQPIGTGISEIKDIEITVPSVIAGSSFKVSGVALGNSVVNIYEDGTLLASGKANAAGMWCVDCELTNPYNLSRHSIYAKITTPANTTFTTETKTLTYDVNALQVSRVTMYHYNPEMCKTYESVFDFMNPKTSSTQWTVYYPKKQFTYTIEFTDNDPERISNVILYVHTADGKYVPVKASFDDKKRLWYAEIDMGTSSDGYYPINCSVDFDYASKAVLDSDFFASNLNNYDIESTELSETTICLDEILNQVDNQINQDDIQINKIIASLNAVNELLGIPTIDNANLNTNISDNEIEQLLLKGESLISDDIKSFVNNFFTQDYSEINDILEGISINDCSEIDIENLVAKGYEEILRTDGSPLFILSSENGLEIIDFNENKYINFDWSKNAQMRVRMMATSSDDFRARVQIICDGIKDACDRLRSYLSQFADLVDTLESKLLFKEGKLADQILDLDEAIVALKANPKSNKFLISIIETQYKVLTKEALWVNSALRWLQKNISTNGLRVGRFGGGAFAVVDLVFVCQNMMEDMNNVISAYYAVPDPCPDDQTQANSLRNAVRGMGIGAGIFYTAQIVADAASIASAIVGVSAAIPTGGTSLSVVAVSIGLAVANIVASEVYEANFDKNLNNLCDQIGKLKCHKDNECEEDGMPPYPDTTPNPNGNNGGNGGNNSGGGAYQSGSPDDGVQIDPSGFVYEAVPENRVEGVQASIYYKETKEDMYGDPYEEVILWDAEEYAQKNPLFTDENGMYRWDVPQGLWQVKFEKDGYATAYSEWLPVPPPQLEVNIGIVQNKQPEVTEARAYEDGIEVQFDKYMDLSTLNTSNIYVTANGEKLKGEINMVDSALADEYASEDDANATRYASRLRFVPEEKLSTTTGEIRLTVSRNVLSYAGIPMTETYSQVLDVEKEVKAIVADDVKVLYGEEKEVTISAIPFDAAVNRKLHIATSSDLIASIDKTEAVLDEEGKATILVKGDLPGRCQLKFSIDDVTETGDCTVDVVTEIITAEAPKSSRASGTAVYRGTKIELTTESKDATIYFTTDGSCPCDENGTRRKYTVPIVINEDTKILAMTSVGNGDDDISETVEFNYTLKRTDMDFQLNEGWTWISHNLDSPIAPSDLSDDEGIRRVISQTQEVIRDPELGLIGNLTSLSATGNYKVQAIATTSRKRLSDIAWNPSTPISIKSGWNWIGYPVAQTMTVDEAFASTKAEMLDVVVGQTGFSQYDGENWIGTLETMLPGEGYMYFSQGDKNIVYNTSIVSKAAARNITGITGTSPLVVDIHKYSTVMPVVASLSDTNGTALSSEDYTVAAFSGSECRGIGRVVKDLVMMNVYGEKGDPITFLVTDIDGETTYSNDAALEFSEKVVGDIFNPYVITIGDSNGVAEVEYGGNVKVYFDGDILRIKGVVADDIRYVEVYDLQGQKLVHETKVGHEGIRIPTLSDGLYVVIVNSNGKYTYHKVAK